MKRLLTVLLTIFMCVSLFAACSSDNDAALGKTDKTQTENSESSPNQNDEERVSSASEPEGEYSEESFMELYDEYEAVAGTGSEKEKELLSEIQKILDSQMQ